MGVTASSARKLLLAFPGLAITLAFAISAAAQEARTGDFVLAAAQGREVVVLPTEQASGSVRQERGTVYGYAFESGDRRVHVIEFEGEVFRAATPLEGPASRIAFDPSRRTFVPLLPSIRVEVESQERLDAVAKLFGSTNSVYFDRLGFGIVDLPEDLHPLKAVERLKTVSGPARASIRLRRRPLEWR